MSDIQRINPQSAWSDAVVHSGTVYFVEVPESGTDITSQSQAVFAQAERTLALAGSDKSRLLIATIYLKHMTDRAAFNTAWQTWLPQGCAPGTGMRKRRNGQPGLFAGNFIHRSVGLIT